MKTEMNTPQSVIRHFEKNKPLRIVIPGGSGQVGSVLARAFRSQGHDVVIISRKSTGQGQTITWDVKTHGEWTHAIDGADVVINLAGHPVNCRYNPANRARIMQSRVDSTRLVLGGIEGHSSRGNQRQLPSTSNGGIGKMRLTWSRRGAGKRLFAPAAAPSGRA